jgi:hypothetical protein
VEEIVLPSSSVAHWTFIFVESVPIARWICSGVSDAREEVNLNAKAIAIARNDDNGDDNMLLLDIFKRWF